jgi:hypothetical protein
MPEKMFMACPFYGNPVTDSCNPIKLLIVSLKNIIRHILTDFDYGKNYFDIFCLPGDYFF